jgi:hypothetical protein
MAHFLWRTFELTPDLGSKPTDHTIHLVVVFGRWIFPMVDGAHWHTRLHPLLGDVIRTTIFILVPHRWCCT